MPVCKINSKGVRREELKPNSRVLVNKVRAMGLDMPIIITVVALYLRYVPVTTRGGPITGPAIRTLTTCSPRGKGRRRLPLDSRQLLNALAVQPVKDFPAPKTADLVTDHPRETPAVLGSMIFHNLVELLEDVLELDQIAEATHLGGGTVSRANAAAQVSEALQNNEVRGSVAYLLVCVTSLEELFPTMANPLNNGLRNSRAILNAKLENTTAHTTCKIDQNKQICQRISPDLPQN